MAKATPSRKLDEATTITPKGRPFPGSCVRCEQEHPKCRHIGGKVLCPFCGTEDLVVIGKQTQNLNGSVIETSVLGAWDLACHGGLRTTLNMKLSGGHTSFIRKIANAYASKGILTEKQLAKILQLASLPKYRRQREAVKEQGDWAIPAKGIQSLSIEKRHAEEQRWARIDAQQHIRTRQVVKTCDPSIMAFDQDKPTVTDAFRSAKEALLKAQEDFRLASLAVNKANDKATR